MAKIQKYKVKSGFRWRVRWTVEGEQKSKTFAKWNHADDFRKSLEHNLAEGTYTQPTDITLAAYLAAWIESYKANIAPSTENGYRVNVRHISGILGAKKLQKVNAVDIESMYAELSEKLSGTSLLYVHRVLSRALKQAVRQRLINSNPCAFVDPPKKNKDQGAQFIHANDVPKYLAALDGSYLYPAACLALFCGLRRGEVLGLQWADINNGKMAIRHNMTYTGLRAPKSGYSRIIPITPPIKAMLQAQREKQNRHKEILWNKYHKSDFIVTYDDGKLIDPRTFSNCFKRILIRNGLPAVRFHDLRHTAASLMIMEGVDIKTVSEVLGHQSIKITADTYGHIADEHKLDAMNRLNHFFPNAN